MNEQEQFLDNLINAAKSGDQNALEELSIIAMGGNGLARVAIHDIDLSHRKFSTNISPIKLMVWPREVEEGKRGLRLGDVAISNEV